MRILFDKNIDILAVQETKHSDDDRIERALSSFCSIIIFVLHMPSVLPEVAFFVKKMCAFIRIEHYEERKRFVFFHLCNFVVFSMLHRII